MPEIPQKKSFKYIKGHYGELLIGTGVLVLSIVLILASHSRIVFPNIIEIGSLKFNLYGLFLAFGFLLPFFLLEQRIKSDDELKKMDFPLLDLMIVLAASVLGARTLHVIADWDRIYSSNPIKSIYIREGGATWFGALLFGFLALAVISNQKKYNFKKLLDFIVFGVPLVQMISRFGNFFNQEIFGAPTDLPWGLYIEAMKRPVEFSSFEYFHPAFFYEQLGNYIIIAIILLISGAGQKSMTGPQKKSPSPSRINISLFKFFQVGKGNLPLLYIFLYGLLRLAVEQFRLDQDWLVGLSFGEFCSLTFILAGPAILSLRFWRFSRSTAEK